MAPLQLKQLAGVPISIAGDLMNTPQPEQRISAADGAVFQLTFVQMEPGRSVLLITEVRE